MRRSTTMVWTTLIATLVAAPLLHDSVADAKPRPKPKTKQQTIKAHMNRATKAHKAGKFEVALTELEAAYELDPQPKLLFAIAQVQSKLDRCDGAIENYKKFLDTTKDKQKRAIVKQAIDACETKLAAAPAPAPEPAADGNGVFGDQKVETAPSPSTVPEPPPEPAPVTEPVIDQDDSPLPPAAPVSTTTRMTSNGGSAWYTDVLGDVLVVGGLGAGVASVLLYTKARGELDDAEGATSLASYEQLVSKAHDHRTYSIILGGAGAALVVSGIVRYALHGSGESPTVAVVPAQGGGLVTYGGGF